MALRYGTFVASVLAAASSTASFAQSSVTLFGVVDAGIARMSASGAGHSAGLVSGGSSSSRLGFRGTEDLGGGLSAGFWLEGALNNDVGAGASQTTGLDFARRSTVSLSNTFGELRMGRDYTPIYVNMIAYDTWGQRGVGTIETTGTSRAGVGSYARTSNGVTYFLPKRLGGFSGSIQYAFGEQLSTKQAVANPAGISTSAGNASTDKTGDVFGISAGFANGPFAIGVAYTAFIDAVRTSGASSYAADYKVANIGASYDFGFVRTKAFYQSECINGRGPIAEVKSDTWALGGAVPLGSAGEIKSQIARFSQNASANDHVKLSIGYTYPLSKRTALYADVARLKNKGAGTVAINNLGGSIASPSPTPGGSSTGYVVGMRHSF
ncbi:porin [uncultured Xylophilus sp.]|uniref:porin n=1 Tax=uncultured Xylophilus sp. TaxID=296832 RepID=UPI0025D49BCD|nr:porin [uncultured Xylophilus sp.]